MEFQALAKRERELMRVETHESSRESMKVKESWPNESESSREFVESFSPKQKREPGNRNTLEKLFRRK